MNWEIIGAVSEVVASLAVVASLFYLARQVRSSIGIERARASFDATHSWAASNKWLHQDVEFQGLLTKYLEANTLEGDDEPLDFGATSRAESLDWASFRSKYFAKR